MKILQVSATDCIGGAATVAWNLHKTYQSLGHESVMIVGKRMSADPSVIEIGCSHERTPWRSTFTRLYNWSCNIDLPGGWRLRSMFKNLSGGTNSIRESLGVESHDYPASRQILEVPGIQPSVVHCHNLHGGYFDLRYLELLSRRVPVCLTLHDEWLLTGHCAYSFECERWKFGCGRCPDLTIPPAIRRDGTHANWLRKRKVYTRSRLYVTTPSKWLADRVAQSMLRGADRCVIPNGVDLSVFTPGSREQARQEVGLCPGVKVLLFVAHGMKTNSFKDYRTVERAVSLLKAPSGDVLLVLLGGDAEGETRLGDVRVLNVPFASDRHQVATWYRAADIFIHSAHVDNFPNTILEALACGIPVVATDVGGIPEQLTDGATGILVPPHRPDILADAILRLVSNPMLCQEMGRSGVACVNNSFSITKQAKAYISWYSETIECYSRKNR